jgi:two-component sensor histidine kinase/Tfp pilus assembly protein PilF
MIRYSLFLPFFLMYNYSYAQSYFHRLMDLGQSEIEADDIKSAKITLKKALEHLPEGSSPEDKAVLFNNLGVVYSESGEYKKGIYYYEDAVKFYREAKIDTLIAGALFNLGIAYKDLGASGKAMEALRQAARIFEAKGKQQELARVWNTIGNLQRDIGVFPKSIAYHQKALHIREQMNLEEGIADSYHNLGSTYLEWKRYSEAEYYLLRAMELKKCNKQPNTVTTISALGRLYIAQNHPEKAFPFLSKAYEMRRSAGNSPKAAESLSYLAIYFATVGEHKKAFELFHQTEEIARSTDNWQLLAEALEGEIALLEQTRESTRLTDKYRELLSVREKEAKEANRKEADRLEINYDTERKNHVIENERLKNSRLKLSLSLAGLVIGTAGTAAYRLRRRKKQIERKNGELERQKQDITYLHHELSHRTTNYFGLLSGILISDKNSAKEEETLRVLNDNIRRLETMALIQHYLLSDASKRGHTVELKAYLGQLVEDLLDNLLPRGSNLDLECEIEEMHLDYDKALRLAIVLNELVCNAIEHSLTNSKNPRLQISVKHMQGSLMLVVHDNGKGIIDSLPETSQSKGLGLIAKLLEYLDGTIAYANEGGCKAVVSVQL